MKSNEKELRSLLRQLLTLIREHDTRSQPVRQFIRENQAAKDFEKLAMTVILLTELSEKEERIAHLQCTAEVPKPHVEATG